jgi:polyribonucleotide nucleotidyltransferase
MKKIEIDLSGTPLVLETGKMAKQANGAVSVKYGNTFLLTASVGSDNIDPNASFFPLTCQFYIKHYAQGKIPGGFIKRENRQSDFEILTSRMVDRPIRPLFEDWYKAETQVITTVMSYKEEFSPEPLAILGASTSLLISDLPFHTPIAGVRVGYLDEKFIANPAAANLEKSLLDLFIVASDNSIVMVESSAKQLDEDIMLKALDFGFQYVQPIIKMQKDLAKEVGKPKMTIPVDLAKKVEIPEKEISESTEPKLKEALFIKTKIERSKKVKEVIKQALSEHSNEENESTVRSYLDQMVKNIIRGEILTNKKRVDGRGDRDIRAITCELGILPETHGSALFTRGETQALVILTLGTKDDAQNVDNVVSNEQKKFYLHYNFPAFSVGEVKRAGPPSRREIGHGRLIEKSVESLLPALDQNFPYTVRLVSEILESNGSSSMASVCGASLALMDGGVPTGGHVAGIAMGLVKENENYVILSDILGDEDHVGDMDFKVAGTKNGITGLQMDIKIDGLSQELMREALMQAKEGRLKILDTMEKTIPQSKTELAFNAPRYIQYKVDTSKIKKIIGTGGQTIKSIVNQTGVKIDINDSGIVNIAAYNQKSAEEALVIIQSLVQELEIGKIYEAVVKKIITYGAFVECLPGLDGFLHIADISNEHIEKLEDHLKEGQMVTVKATGYDKRGNVRVSIKEAKKSQ